MTRPIDPVYEALDRFLPNMDRAVVEAILACVLANRLEGPPVWLMLVAPPSSGKTVLLEPLEGICGAYILSKLTPNTLLSGKIEKGDGAKDASLLTRLGEQPVIVIKELSTLLEDPRNRSQIFAQLREVYDGHMVMEFGTGERKEWQGKGTIIAGITPAIDLYSFDSILGSRFLKLRFENSQSPEEAAHRAWHSIGQEHDGRNALHKAYYSALENASHTLGTVTLSKQTVSKLAQIAAFLAMARTDVPRNQFRQDRIELPVQTEATPRVMKSMGLFAKALAALRGECDLSDFTLVYRLALDSAPEPRRSILMKCVRLLYTTNTDGVSVSDLSGIVSDTYTSQIVEDLQRIGLVEPSGTKITGTKGRPPTLYNLASDVRGWLKESGMLSFILTLREEAAVPAVA